VVALVGENDMIHRRSILLAGAAAGAVGLAGCASQNLSGYAAERPLLDLRTYFNGVLDAYGVFQDRSGQVVRRFTVVMNCSWDGDQGVLDEDFIYSDGEKQKRIWRLTHEGNGRYTGTAEDVVGTAEGQVSGNAFNWTYTLRLPVGDRLIDVQFDDWMYLVDDRAMLNKAVMSKFGIRLGEVTLAFFKRGA